ncbi:MAG: hypothetical protein H6732_11570 [Alphaproteobacteria bacterium]|nr:hypothetical protein [Alphaproteobacteria bacterium]
MRAIRSFVASLAWMSALARVRAGLVLGLLGLAPLAFLDQRTAAVVAVGFWSGGVSMFVLHARFGFTRLLSLAHLCWLPGVVLLTLEAAPVVPEGGYGAWLQAALVVSVLVLVADVRDVARWIGGDRAPLVTLPG